MDALKAEGIGDLPVLIAAAATVRIEATKLFAPIHEFPDANGNYPPHYSGGSRFHGRGFIQLTHDYNYRAYGDLLGVDLYANPDLALDPSVAARVLASYFRQRGIADKARAGDWTAVRKAVQGGAAGLALFKQSVKALEDATSAQEPPPANGPSLVKPVKAVGQFERASYDTAAEFTRMKGAACSAAALAAVLTAYGKPVNISGALALIRGTGDDVLPDSGLQNRNGQAQAIADVLAAVGIPARTHPQSEITRELLRSLLPERPVIGQMQVLHGGHYLVLRDVDPSDEGVWIEDSNAGPGKWTWVNWVTLWAGWGDGRGVWAD